MGRVPLVSMPLMFLFLAMLVMLVSMVLDTTESVMLMLNSLMLVSMETTDILLLMVLLLLPLVLPIPPTLEFATILLVLRFHAKLLIYSETYFSSNTLAQSWGCKAGCLKFCSQRKIFDLQSDIGKCTSV